MSKRGVIGVVALCAVLSACTAIHTPEPYLPQRSGVIPGKTITVGNNQNIYGVAQDNGVSMREIIVLNGLHEPFALKPGQSLVLPYKKGDMTSGIMSADGVSAAPIGGVQEMPLPGTVSQQPLSPPAYQSALSKNILGESVASVPLDVINVPPPAPKQVATTMAPSQPTSAPPALSTPAVSAPVAAASAGAPTMIWPVQGPKLSGFGPKGQGVNNDGVNIGAPKGSPVVAAANGIVVYAGDDMKGFGNLVLIRHEGGWVTAYTYLDRVLVAKDAVVAQGDMIGTVGKSGNISSPQLHFETRHDGKAVDPDGVIK